MGEASRRKLTEKAQADLLAKINIPHISSAIMRLAKSASEKYGLDCYVHADLCSQLLKKLGVSNELTVGFAAWRVGDNDGDVIVHMPAKNASTKHIISTDHQANDPHATPYHAWIEVAGGILDFTTYQLKDKARMLDKIDGGTTTVNWCPDYIFARKTDCATFNDVAQKQAGLFFYKRDMAMDRHVKSQAQPLDEYDLFLLESLYYNQDTVVFGPNDIKY